MPCKEDVRQAILNSVFSEVSDGRYTFNRIGNDTIQINGRVDNDKTKALSNKQAMAIANEVVSRIEQSYNGHVKGYINQGSAYEPVTIRFEPSEAYIEHEYSKIPLSQRTDANDTGSLERSHILTDTGHNTYEQLYLFAPTGTTVGAYVKMANFKENQLSVQRNKLKQNQAEQKAKDITDTKLLKLKREERDLKLGIEGDYVKGVKGLVQEIAQLKAESDKKAVAYYVQKDLDRLKGLSQSENLEDLKEAQRIVEFYDAAGTFTIGKDNPFFLQEEMFLDNGLPFADPNYKLTSDLRQPESTMQQYRDWRAKAKEYENIIEDKRRRIFVDEVNKDYGVKNTYTDANGAQKKFSFEELTNAATGLKDTDWFSMWTMDISSGVWSTNGVLPQVMRAKLVNGMEEKEAWSRDISHKIDEITPKVQEELTKLDNGKYTLRATGILGLKGASYQIYKEITKDGNETGGLIQRFTPEYNEAESKATGIFWSQFNKARELADPQARIHAINRSFDDLKRWKRNNSIIIDITKLSTIANDPQLAEFKASGDTNYENQLIGLLGKKGFDEHVEEQRKLLRRYQTERQAYEEGLLLDEGKNIGDTLSQSGQAALSYWESNHHPTRAIEDYKSIGGVIHGNRKANSFMDFNVFAARKYKPTITANNTTGEYDFGDTTDETGNYSENFAKIEGNTTLSKFYDMVKEVSEKIRDNVPYEIQQEMKPYSLPSLDKVSAELILDKNLSKIASLSLSFRHLMDRIRTSFGITKQSEISYATKDPITGEENSKVNDSFLHSNSRAIHERETVEGTNFLQLFNTNNKGVILSKITKHSNINLSSMNNSSILELSKFLHIDIPYSDIVNGKLNVIKNRLEPITHSKTGAIVDYNVPIGKLIHDYSVHTVVQSQSFDLPKLTRHFSNMTMGYAARQEALPLLEIMKHYYEGIKRPSTTTLGIPRFNAKDKEMMKKGLRVSGIKQMDDYFKRVAIDNYGGEHFGEFGFDTKFEKVSNPNLDKSISKLETERNNLDKNDPKYKDKVDNINEQIAKLESQKVIPTLGNTIYTKEEREKLGEIQRLLSKEKYGDQSTKDLQKLKGSLENQRIPGYTDTALEEDIAQVDKVLELKKIQQGLGKTRTVSAGLEGLLSWTRTLMLGYNLGSAATNFLDGLTSNVILGADGSYFDSKEIFYAYGVIWSSLRTKAATFGMKESNVGRKNRILADMFKVVIDSTDELQKSSHQSPISSKLNAANPHDLNRRVEFINQTPIMIAMLRTLRIKDKNGNESSVWDAYDYDGKLKPEFRTTENIENWEKLEGEQYINFKQKLNKAIGIGHGLGYDEMRGMMAKSSTAGKAAMMFKTWIPSALYWRFALTQDDLELGKKGFKGRYRSYTSTGAALHGAVVGMAVGGPVTAAILGGLGYAWGRFGGTETEVSGIKQTLEATKVLFKKLVGMPINIMTSRDLINQDDKAFDKWIGSKFSAQDAMNMRANMADLGMQLLFLALGLMTKALFWDDDDDPQSLRRKAHNLFANKFAQLGSQSAMYINPVDTYKNTLGSIATLEYLKNIYKEVTAFEKFSQGKDIEETGANAGQSRVWNQTKKLIMPGIFKQGFLGLGNEMSKEFTPSPYQHLFTSKEKLDKQKNEGYRAERSRELEKEISLDSIMKKLDEAGYQFNTKEEKEKAAKDLQKKQIRSILNTELPTPAKLKKYGVTRKEYEEYLEQQNQQSGQ